MGTNTSKAAQPLLAKKKGYANRQYNLPDAREKVRFEPEETMSTTTAYEASIVKFDYLIVFPLTETRGPHKGPVMTGAEQQNNRISWATIKDLWGHAAFGTDEHKERAIDELSRFWARRTGSIPADSDFIRMRAWQTLAREAILEKLTMDSGLQCKLTANPHFIFCRVRAPMKLLEYYAEKFAYPLSLRGEIDPGSEEFWNRELLKRNEQTDQVEYVPVELQEEKREYTREEAVTILERLYHVGKIGPNELGLRDETQAQWSLRVHALERSVDKVPVHNDYPAYADFSMKPQKRHLFQVYPTVRGHTLFRAKDRLFLTKRILGGSFDLEKLEQRNVIFAVMALHDANRGERITKDVLRRKWVDIWSGDLQVIGAPYVTHVAYDEEIKCPRIWRFHAQPLADICDYFGEKVALYFAWFGYYTCWLSMLFLFSNAMYVAIAVRGETDVHDTFDWCGYIYFLVLIVWSEMFQHSWLRENEAIKIKWGTHQDVLRETIRPQFQGIGPLVRSTVHNNKMAVFPSEIRTARQIGSYLIIFCTIVLNLSLILGVFWVEYLVIKKYKLKDDNEYVNIVHGCVQAIILVTNAHFFPLLSSRLNDWENYRTDQDYDQGLIMKTLVFQVITNFAAATFTTFGKGIVFGECSGGSCIGDLRILLIAIIVVRSAVTVWWIIRAMVGGVVDDLYLKTKSGLDKVEGDMEEEDELLENEADNMDKAELLRLNEETDDDKQYQDEIKLSEYQGTFGSYSASAVQFGFVSLFSVALPLLPVYALLENFVLIRVQAWSLCVLHRRPHVVSAEDIGGWSIFLKILSYMGVVWGCGIIVFAGPNFKKRDLDVKVIIFLSAVLALMCFKVCVSMILSGESDWITNVKRRNQYIINKYVIGQSSDDKAATAHDSVKGVLDNNVDAESLNLYDLRKGHRVTEEEYVAMGELEAKRRALMKEVRLSKERLRAVYKTETFNENTGIGETKHGLALGRLSVKLIQIEGLLGEGLEDIAGKVQRIKVRISIRAIRKGTQVVPPFGDLCDSSPLVLSTTGNSQIDQVMGPYAPIRAIDAEVVFDVLNLNEDEASIAVAVISLRELQDQVPHDMVLPLKVLLLNGKLASTGRLFLNMHFQFSRVLPIRRRIYEVQGKLREVERDLALLKAGKLCKQDSTSHDQL